jgi:transcriptional regulator with GAF, ATPase, and Fis domain
MDKLVEKLMTSSAGAFDLACIQIWLIDKAEKPMMYLEAEAGRSVVDLSKIIKFGTRETRVPFGEGLIGRAAATGRQEIGRIELFSEVSKSLGLNWLERENIITVGATPIMFREEVLGVIVGFLRIPPDDQAELWARVIGEHIGAAVANARAFNEIARLKAQLELQNSYLQEEVIEAKAFGDIIGESAALRQIANQIDLVAPTDASVLILGETGTGKELVAHEIHRRSPRKDGPMVRVNCASIPRELFESEFFGHVRGAFTGAIREREGRFAAAEGGTLFLDEIGDLPLDMQAKLLRVLQEKRYERVGDNKTHYANVRIIGATHRDLKKAAMDGRFREDLYYRLNVFPIYVPPLRERKEDLRLLAAHFVQLSAKTLRCAKPRLTRASLGKLQAYDWPGNVRELRSVIERGVILARGGALDFDLPGTPLPTVAVRDAIGVNDETKPEFLTQAELDRRERENLLAILRKTNGKIKGPEGAAECLGVKPATLFSRLRRMGIKATV